MYSLAFAQKVLQQRLPAGSHWLSGLTLTVKQNWLPLVGSTLEL
jgi:hypothetical protein